MRVPEKLKKDGHVVLAAYFRGVEHNPDTCPDPDTFKYERFLM